MREGDELEEKWRQSSERAWWTGGAFGVGVSAEYLLSTRRRVMDERCRTPAGPSEDLWQLSGCQSGKYRTLKIRISIDRFSSSTFVCRRSGGCLSLGRRVSVTSESAASSCLSAQEILFDREATPDGSARFAAYFWLRLYGCCSY